MGSKFSTMMDKKYTEYKQLELTKISEEVGKEWERKDTFGKSIERRRNSPSYVFYEGPPSANGKPGIHHVMARAIKDIFCRYKTQKGFFVERKAGWDTHGLPIEIAVEKTLNISKEDIGTTISVEDYNKACRKEVMKYKDQWDDLTIKMGYWVDLDNPYITFDNKYIESVWWSLGELYKKGLLYKGYTIQPYSPAAGTGLSSHELNLPGCYKNVKDNTVVAQFRLPRQDHKIYLEIEKYMHGEIFFLAWTTTPWTLPSNTALAVGKNITYSLVQSFNPYTHMPITVILAKDLVARYFPEKNALLELKDYVEGSKDIPYKIVAEFKGKDLHGLRYEQLLPYAQPEDGDAFMVVVGDFVTTEDGTGIVHIAPSFGADDFRTSKQYGLGSLTMVDKSGRFVEEMGEFAGEFVKPDYDITGKALNEENVDIKIIVKLKKENKAFKAEKYEHSYPHCWRTDKPILYYPLDSWFIRTTSLKAKLIELNKTINWKPEATGTGRFGNWLENLVDWNLSRSRFWGIPLPIWTSEDRDEQICISSAAQLKNEIQKAVDAGFMNVNPYMDFDAEDLSDENYQKIDLHRPYVDEIVLVSPTGKKMYREPDLIDVWYDSGSMPFAQFHYPFENKEKFEQNFPADFIAEGVDQTRGWFFTLHTIAAMLFDSVSYKTVVSNGLVLDKSGNKMSKRLGNAVDPFEVISKYGPDATRWYMITNSQPWENLKFDIEGIAEVQRKFFGTLYNTYSFFALYANIDGFYYKEPDILSEKQPEIDRWILSELNTLIKETDKCYADYEPTKAGRLIEDFVDEYLSNWYVRLSRRRFWKGEYSEDKISAFQTLYKCLITIAQLAAPIAPFFSERLFSDLNNITGRSDAESVHLSPFPVTDEKYIDAELEQRMQLAQKISSMALSLRKKMNIRVRQPLSRILIPVPDEAFKERVESVRKLILSEINVKNIEYIDQSQEFLVNKIKPNFKTLGPKYGKLMKKIADAITALQQDDIALLEKEEKYFLEIDGERIEILLDDVEIITDDIPGWAVTKAGNVTLALDVSISDELKEEGIARELINRIQNLRKESGFEVTDYINLIIEEHTEINSAINKNFSYICAETLATKLELVKETKEADVTTVELMDDVKVKIHITRCR